MKINMLQYLNNDLPWDASELKGKVTIIDSFKCNESRYHVLKVVLDDGSLSGDICCSLAYCNSEIPFIVEEMRSIFNLPKRGLHSAIINGKRAILYYVSISVEGNLIWETPLNKIGIKHPLRKDPLFRYNVQKCLAFCEILLLDNTKEASIILRPGQNTFSPINTNQDDFFLKENPDVRPSPITKAVYNKWFGEETSMSDVVKSMMNYRLFSREPYSDNILLITSEVKDKMEEIINRRDKTYIWYINLVIGQLSVSLLG